MGKKETEQAIDHLTKNVFVEQHNAQEIGKIYDVLIEMRNNIDFLNNQIVKIKEKLDEQN